MSDIPDDAPAPRLSIIVQWPEFDGYGFNLHAEKTKPGQYIGQVDPNSPAEVAGLVEGDRIIEVNGVNIANENHKQVVQRIKAVPGETRLLLLDPKADKYYKSKNIVVRSTQDNVIVLTSAREKAPPPPTQDFLPSAPVSNGHHHDEVDNRSVSSAASSSAASEASTQPQPAAATTETEKESVPEDVEETMEAPRNRSPSPTPRDRSPSPAPRDRSPSPAPRDRSPSPLPEEGDDSSQKGDIKPVEEHIPPPAEDESLQDDNDKHFEEELKPSIDDSSSQEGDGAPSESEIIPAEGIVSEEGKAVEAEVPKEEAPPSPESDLEAEYDNVELVEGKGGAEVGGGAVPPTSTSRRSSSASSSAGSHSSRGSDAAHTDPSTQSPMSTSPTPPPSLEPAPVPAPSPVSAPAPPTTTTTTTTKPPPPQPVTTNNTYKTGGLNLNMSAAEMRAMLARKKKTDPRNDSLDLRKKYEIIQNM